MSAAIGLGELTESPRQFVAVGLFVIIPTMRIHPISLALRRLRGERSIHRRVAFETIGEAVDSLKKLTGQDFGADARKWGEWLRKNRWVYYTQPTSKSK